jgi:hypothetical protein
LLLLSAGAVDVAVVGVVLVPVLTGSNEEKGLRMMTPVK